MSDYLKLKTMNCRNCYKCIRHCPVKSIRFDDDQAHIIEEECVLCGNCFVACPQNAKEIRDDTAAVEALLAGEAPVYASVAPSFRANYGGLTISSMAEVLEQLGFAGVEETARGAAVVKQHYDAMTNEESRRVILSSCCHTVNLLVQKHFPEALGYLAPVLSPMLVHCLDLKRRFPGAKTVYIGPCISKKAEAESSGDLTDGVLTFGELSAWIDRKHIAFPLREEEYQERSLTRFFPIPGGILRTMKKQNPRYTYLSVDGIENCINAVKDVLSGVLDRCFIEMSACTGSCTGGPAMECRTFPVRNAICISTYAGREDFEVFDYSREAVAKPMEDLRIRRIRVGDQALDEVLAKLGKTSAEDELNCGSCGYNTCREKALAVLQGKATLTMCLPYLKEKAESFSDHIIRNTPNAVILLNESFEVQQINAAACALMHIESPHTILGDQVVRILDPLPFFEVSEKKQNRYHDRVFLADYQKHVDQTIIYDQESHLIICIMRDVTEEVVRRETREAFNREALAITDKVIEKQMRAVQEIASLLGETSAETKIALTTLKESLNYE